MDLLQSLYNLIQTNNGKFKSVKQGCFLRSQSVGMEIVTHGGAFDKAWTDFWLLDDEGIVSQTRRQKSGKMTEQWNRNGDSEVQIKNKKSLDRHNAKIAAHSSISVEAEKYYNELCIAEFGYVPCNEKREALWSVCSSFENTTPLHMLAIIKDVSVSELLEYHCDEAVEFSNNYDQLKNVMDWYTNELKGLANKLLDIRCKVQTAHPSKLPYAFM